MSEHAAAADALHGAVSDSPPPQRRFAYVVLEHADLDRALRLAAAVRHRSPTAHVLLCFNGPLDARQMERVAAAGVRRVGSGRRARWGDSTLLARTMEAVQDALADEWSWIVVVSGQDYPISDLAGWEQRLLDSGVDAVNRAAPMSADDVELVQRYACRWFVLNRLGDARGLPHRAAVRLVKTLRRRWDGLTYRIDGADVWIGVPTGRPLQVRLWKGWFWTALSRPAAVAVLRHYRDAPLARLLEHSLFPEEAYLPTVLRQLDLVVEDADVSLTMWEPDDPAHPRVLDLADLPLLQQSAAPFARKFAGPSRGPLLDALDAQVSDAVLPPGSSTR